MPAATAKFRRRPVSAHFCRHASTVAVRFVSMRGAKNGSRRRTRSNGTGASGAGGSWTASARRAASHMSVLPLRQRGGRVGRVEEAVGDDDALLERLALRDPVERVEGLRAEQRAALDRAGELARDD